jgi:FkbM family methyltransferase
MTSRPLRRVLRRSFDRLFFSDTADLREFGRASPWTIIPRLVPRDGIVLSGGVGQDISFEKTLVQHWNCRVELFDPTPTGCKTMALSENRVDGVNFHRVGLAGKPAEIDFSFPRDPEEGSFGWVGTSDRPRLKLRCDAISAFAAARGIHRVDILKLDIEGFEYEVLEDVLSSNLRPAQICVEFHHFLPGIPVRRTLRTIGSLLRAGYRIAYKRECDYLFVNKACDICKQV